MKPERHNSHLILACAALLAAMATMAWAGVCSEPSKLGLATGIATSAGTILTLAKWRRTRHHEDMTAFYRGLLEEARRNQEEEQCQSQRHQQPTPVS